MDTKQRIFSGKEIGGNEIETIKWVLNTYTGLSRKEIAATICEMLEWNTPAGNAKTPQCLKCLDTLEKEGIIVLPPLNEVRRKRSNRAKLEIKEAPAPKEEVRSCGIVELHIARRGKDLNRWKAYIDGYHMLGYKQEFGSRLQYFIVSDGEELGCIQFSAAAWALAPRDEWIGWDSEAKKSKLNLIVNNSRFLIFPWVHVKNLASRALSLATKRIPADWLREFSYAPVLMETFVDMEHFKGTCYKASNWTRLGETKGRGRMDRHNEYALSKKAIFVYPLRRDFRSVLLGEKQPQMVDQG
jgi:hypothetical protein